MRHVRMLGLCLVAVFAFAAVAAAGSASAAPEWGRCVGQKDAKYTEAGCLTAAAESKGKYKGHYEWKAGAPASVECEAKKKGNYTESACLTVAEKKGVPDHKGHYEKYGPKFTGEGGKGVLSATMYECRVAEEEEAPSGRFPRAECTNEGRGSGYLVEVPNLKVECTSEHASGEAVGSDQVANVSVHFNGCLIFGVDPCRTPGAAAEEIRTEPLKGNLGYIEKATTKVGVLLEPVAAKGRFANLECENIEADVSVGVGDSAEGAFYTPEATGGYDGIISPITPINMMTPKFTQQYTANANRENIPSHFEGGHIELLETFLETTTLPIESTTWSPAGQEITNVNTVEGEAEIKA